VPVGGIVPVGACGLMGIQLEEDRALAGYWIAERARGRGFASAALALLSECALGPPLGLTRLALHIAALNWLGMVADDATNAHTHTHGEPLDPGPAAIGTWSGGRFMHFGEPLHDDRLRALITPDDLIRTVITADVYGAGQADTMLGQAIAGLPRETICVVGAVGHDFYEGERNGPKGFPRFTDASLRGPGAYADYLRMATERSLERCGIDAFDLLLLHNPDRTGYTSEVVWDGMADLREAGLTRMIGVAPGPANGFTLDVIDCLERFGSVIDWAMIILNPLEPWPGELVLDAAAKNAVRLITRVVDYGGLFWDDVRAGTEFERGDHRGFRPAGWVDAGVGRIEALRPIAQHAGLTMMQLACQWNLAHPAVDCVAPTLIQEIAPNARTIEDKRAELAALPVEIKLTAADVAEIRALGDNTGCMALKGANPDHEGDEQPDRWRLDEHLLEVARRWQIEPTIDLTQRVAA
jgi:aryl-alcohol dehydrogenase-like predicted oxidoreductase